MNVDLGAAYVKAFTHHSANVQRLALGSQSRPRSELWTSRMRTRNVSGYVVTSDDVRFIMYGWNTEEERMEADCSLSLTSAGLQLSGDSGRSFSCLSDKR
jgi:hypothetical protein